MEILFVLIINLVTMKMDKVIKTIIVVRFLFEINKCNNYYRCSITWDPSQICIQVLLGVMPANGQGDWLTSLSGYGYWSLLFKVRANLR